MRRPTRRPFRGRLIRLGYRAKPYAQTLRRGSGDSMYTRKAYATREAPWRGQSNDQLEAREGQAGRLGVAERFVVPLKLGNASGREGASVQDRRNTWGRAWEIGQPINSTTGSGTADGVARQTK